MGRAPCCDKANVKRGPWSPEEDMTLKNYVERHGTGGNWIALPQKAGLKRCGKSCRLRWLNYLRPDIKHGGFTEEEDNIIYTLYRTIGSRWSVIASNLQGRTDNDVKNYWNTKLKKKLHTLQSSTANTSSIAKTTASLPPPATLQTMIKTEPFGYGIFSTPVEPITFTPPAPFADQIIPRTNFAGINGNGYVVSPPGQDISAASSSSLTVDNNSYGYMEGFALDMGFVQPSELLNWYGFHDRNGENSTTAATSTTTNNIASDLANVSNLWTSVESKPPHGMHQSLTYS